MSERVPRFAQSRGSLPKLQRHDRAPLGTHERFIDFLIEHYAGNFPLRIAPDQVCVIMLNDDLALIGYAKPIVAELRANMVRVDADFSATPFKAKISNAELL